MNREDIYRELDAERQHQFVLWRDKPHSVGDWLIIIDRELNEAKEGWMKNKAERHSAMSEIMQIAAVCIAAMEQHGIEGNGVADNDALAACRQVVDYAKKHGWFGPHDNSLRACEKALAGGRYAS